VDATDEDGERRLENPRDYVRLEIEAALARDIRVVPVLIHGARIPKEAQLPESLVPLLERNAIELSRAHWDADVERLVIALERVGVERSRAEAAEREQAEREQTRRDAAARGKAEHEAAVRDAERARAESEATVAAAAARQREQAQREQASKEAARRKQAQPEPAHKDPPDGIAAAQRPSAVPNSPLDAERAARPEARAREASDLGRFAGAIGVLPWLVIISGLATVVTTFAHWYDATNAGVGTTDVYSLWAQRAGVAAGIVTSVCISMAIVAWTSLRPSKEEPRKRTWMLAVAGAASLTAAVLAFAALQRPSDTSLAAGYDVNNGVVAAGMASAVLMTVFIGLLWATPGFLDKIDPPQRTAGDAAAESAQAGAPRTAGPHGPAAP
jgi:hypothetical protein